MTKGTKEWTGRPVTLNRMMKKGLASKESNLGLSDLEILLSQNQGKEKEPFGHQSNPPLPFYLLFQSVFTQAFTS